MAYAPLRMLQYLPDEFVAGAFGNKQARQLDVTQVRHQWFPPWWLPGGDVARCVAADLEYAATTAGVAGDRRASRSLRRLAAQLKNENGTIRPPWGAALTAALAVAALVAASFYGARKTQDDLERRCAAGSKSACVHAGRR